MGSLTVWIQPFLFQGYILRVGWDLSCCALSLWSCLGLVWNQNLIKIWKGCLTFCLTHPQPFFVHTTLPGLCGKTKIGPNQNIMCSSGLNLSEFSSYRNYFSIVGPVSQEDLLAVVSAKKLFLVSDNLNLTFNLSKFPYKQKREESCQTKIQLKIQLKYINH